VAGFNFAGDNLFSDDRLRPWGLLDEEIVRGGDLDVIWNSVEKIQ
tara:strand:- start:40 stop:174 length:135 start_codon:yes stop_codon:yes gene_type:complete